MQVDLTNSTALVTGAGRGNGEAIAKRLGANGAAVVLNDVKAEPAEATVTDIEADGGEAKAIMADLRDAAAVQAMFERARDAHGSVDVLVNNAGIADSIPVVDSPAPEKWAKALNTHLWRPSTAVRRPSTTWSTRATGRQSISPRYTPKTAPACPRSTTSRSSASSG